VVATGAALFQPTVSTISAEGVVLSVQATVSPDQKYVYLDMRPQLSRLLDRVIAGARDAPVHGRRSVDGDEATQLLDERIGVDRLRDQRVDAEALDVV